MAQQTWMTRGHPGGHGDLLSADSRLPWDEVAILSECVVGVS